MNVRNIIFIQLIFIACFAYGQNTIPVSLVAGISDQSSIVTKTIVRAYKGYSVAYIERGGGHFFTISDTPSQTNPANNIELKKAEISGNYSVEDFKVYGDYIYCCGIYANSRGFIGFANIKDLLEHSTFDFKAYNNFKNPYELNYYVNKLYKLEVYESMDELRIVAIGKTINSNNKSKSCLLKIATFLDSTNIAYKIIESSSDREEINDIAVTDNYVVTVGSIFGRNEAAIRRFDKYHLVSNLTTVYTYPTNENNSTLYIAEDINDFLITKVSGDTIAIASYWYIPAAANLGTNLRGTLVRIYDLSTTTAPTMMTSMSVNQNYYIGNWKLKEFQYNNTFPSFTILQDAEEFSNTLESILTRISFNPLVVQTEYYPNIKLSSLDNVEGTMYCLLNGFSKPTANTYNMLSVKLNNYNNSNTCAVYQSGTISFKSIYTSKIETVPLVTFGMEGEFISIGNIPISTENYINSCVKY